MPKNTERNYVFTARNKSVGTIVEVLIWTGDNSWNWQHSNFFKEVCFPLAVCKYNGSLDFHQGSRFVSVRIGDYLVKSRGNFYQCSPEVFRMTYDILEDKKNEQ